MSVQSQISVKVPVMKISPYYSNEANVLLAVNNNVQTSPALAFASGPGFESKPLVLDLRNLPSVDSPELDSSLRDLLMENIKSGNVFSDDNDDTVSEISACSSVVTLETVDESDLTNTPTGNRKTARASSFNAGSSPRTSERTNEADEEDGRKTAIKKSKKIISDFLTFNAPSSSGNGASEENDEPKPPAQTERRRKLSITKRISPLSLHGIFTGNQSTGSNKQEATSESKETKKTRKLSLQTMFKPSQHSNEKERKRRNTDPQLPPNQQITTTIENEGKKGKDETSTASGRESQTKPVPEQAFFKEDDVKIHDLIKHVLRAHMLAMKEYKRETCDRVCKSICKILKTLVTSMKETENVQCKVVCQAYIGSVRDEGMFATVQTVWENDRDNFAAASYRNDSLFGFASVVTTALY